MTAACFMHAGELLPNTLTDVAQLFPAPLWASLCLLRPPSQWMSLTRCPHAVSKSAVLRLLMPIAHNSLLQHPINSPSSSALTIDADPTSCAIGMIWLIRESDAFLIHLSSMALHSSGTSLPARFVLLQPLLVRKSDMYRIGVSGHKS